MTQQSAICSQRQAAIWLRVGALCGMVVVALGAFGAHALRETLDERALDIYRTAVQYQAIHALAILLCGLLMRSFDAPRLRIAAWLFLLGIVLFSGSLYLLAVTDIRALGMVTPLGGVSFLGAWVMLAFAVPIDSLSATGS